MSWLYVPGSAGSNSGSRSPSPRRASSLTSKGKPTPPRLWSRRWKQARWLRLLSGVTSARSTLDRGAASFIASLRASLASRTAAPGSGRATATGARSGPSWYASWLSANRRSFSSRTFPTSCTGPSLFGETFEGWASVGLRRCFKRPRTSARPTTASGSISSLPTPTALPYGSNRGGAAGRVGPVRPSLDATVQSLPTPSTAMTAGYQCEERRRERTSNNNRAGHRGNELLRRIDALPTPRASDWRSGETSDATAEKNSRPLCEVVARLPTPVATQNRARGKGSVARGGGEVLNNVVARLPTPTATDAKASGWGGSSTSTTRHSGTTLTDAVVRSGIAASAGRRGRLNPRLVEWMLGFPTEWTSSSSWATPSCPSPRRTRSRTSRGGSRGS